jgi:hypothetical protein
VTIEESYDMQRFLIFTDFLHINAASLFLLMQIHHEREVR